MRADLESLVLDTMPLARIIAASIYGTAARSPSGHHLEFEDVLSIANEGLVDAANRWKGYCEKRGYDENAHEFFQFYARRRINGAIYDEFRSRDWASRALRSTFKKIKDANLKGAVSVEEIAVISGLKESEVREVLRKGSLKPVSLDALVQDHSIGEYEGSATFHNWMADATEFSSKVEGSANVTVLLKVFVESFLGLPEEQQVVLALRYFSGVDLKEVAARVGVTEARASSLHTKAVLTVSDALLQAAS